MEQGKSRLAQEFEKKEEGRLVRLNKYISEAGLCSRREADRLIEAGRVQVDGKTAVSGQKVSDNQEILVDGKSISKEEEMVLLAVNKPRGVVCTTDKRWGDQTVEELIHYPKRVFYMGRLDKDSEGLLLMTNNGETFRIILTQGLNRQIRRMCEYFGYQVVKLKRIRIMNIMLGDLPTGSYREISREEQEELYRRIQGSSNQPVRENRGRREEWKKKDSE